MPLIGDIHKHMAGSATVTALYAGAVKVWPAGPPPVTADRTATWRLEPTGVLRLVIDGGTDFPPENMTFTVAVDVFTGDVSQHQGWSLGTNSTSADSQVTWHHAGFGDMVMTIANTAYAGGKVTNSVAVRDFSEHVLRITTVNGGRITLIEVLP
jgi:hypothetical protein